MIPYSWTAAFKIAAQTDIIYREKCLIKKDHWAATYPSERQNFRSLSSTVSPQFFEFFMSYAAKSFMLIACNSNRSTLKIPARPDTTCFIGYSTVMGIEQMSISPVFVSQPEDEIQTRERKTN
jgi:hypothetical protein